MIEQSKQLETVLRIVYEVMNGSGIAHWWLSFGGLWGLVRNGGVVPDDDLDICCLYPQNWERLVKVFASHHYSLKRAMVSDVDGQALYCGFDKPDAPHICVTFWWPWGGYRWFGHDEQHEVIGVGVPAHGYVLKGVQESWVNDETHFRYVEWPGIDAAIKIRVPRFPGRFLDEFYEDWAYQKQRYSVVDHKVQPDKLQSYHRGGANCRIKVHVKSMADFSDKKTIDLKIEKSKEIYDNLLKRTQRK